MTALRGLAVRLGSLREGRKAVILVSEGFSSLLPPQMRDPNAQLPGMFNPAAGNPNAGSSTAEDRARFRSDAQLYGDLRVVFDTANRHNTAIYAIDPRGLATNEFDINENVGGRLDQDYLKATQDTLAALAINTDGRAIINRNDLEKGLRQVVRDTSAYYLIGYNSPRPPTASSTSSRSASSGRACRCGRARATGRPRRRRRPRRARRRSRHRRRRSSGRSATSRAAAAGRLHLDVARHRARQRQPHARDVRVGADPADSRRETPGRGTRPGTGVQPRRGGVLPGAGSARGARAPRRRARGARRSRRCARDRRCPSKFRPAACSTA